MQVAWVRSLVGKGPTGHTACPPAKVLQVTRLPFPRSPCLSAKTPVSQKAQSGVRQRISLCPWTSASSPRPPPPTPSPLSCHLPSPRNAPTVPSSIHSLWWARAQPRLDREPLSEQPGECPFTHSLSPTAGSSPRPTPWSPEAHPPAVPGSPAL